LTVIRDGHPMGAPSKTEGWKSFCGQTFRTRKEWYQTCRSCSKYQDCRTENRRQTRCTANQSEVMRQASSRQATITSMRPEIQQQRAQQLAQWRTENPEKFQEIISKGRAALRQNRSYAMEVYVASLLPTLEEQVQIRYGSFRRQLDFAERSVTPHLWVEMDGPHHFLQVVGEKALLEAQWRDQKLMEAALAKKVCLIRVAMKCFHGSGHRRMMLPWQELFLNLVKQRPSGVFCLGELYLSVPWVSDQLTIFKSPTEHIGSCWPIR